MGKRIKDIESVLIKNIKERNRMLSMNKGKYSQYKDKLSPYIGEAYVMSDYSPKDVTNGLSLMDYTHYSNTDYAKKIDRISGTNKRNAEVYSNLDDKIEYAKIYDNYDDYIVNIDNVLNIGAGVLASTDKLFTDTSVGVTRYFDVPLMSKGTIYTNGGRTGKDTKMATMSNRFFANAMIDNMNVNTDRQRRTDKYGGWINGEKGITVSNFMNQYITPDLVDYYGVNSSTYNRLSDLAPRGHKDGRVEVPNKGITVDEWYKYDDTNNGVNYLTLVTDNAIEYTREKFGRGYLPYSTLNGITYLSHDIESGLLTKENGLHTDVFDGLNTLVRNVGDTLEWEDGHDEKNRANFPNKQSEIDSNNYVPTVFNEEGLVGTNNLLSKTNELFKSNKIKTMIGRFYEDTNTTKSIKDSAVDKKYGNAHARALRAKTVSDSNGYLDPYCRSWTYHKQYSRYLDLIRPFSKDKEKVWTIEEVQKYIQTKPEYRSYVFGNDSSGNKLRNGSKYLSDNTVLMNNGLVRMTPTEKSHNGSDITKCMFSIENLAWKDIDRKHLSEEQRGPNGGRIMWFPPYELEFSENLNVNWNGNTFIGRGEQVYTYSNTDRTGSISFSILIDHPVIANSFKNIFTDGDDDNNILRYFAGCHDFNLTDEEKNWEPEPIEEEGVKEENIPEDEPATDGDTIEFSVFFPNNYSGNWHNGDLSNGKSVPPENPDGDWWLYLLAGNGVDFGMSIDEMPGYEIYTNGVDNGISCNNTQNSITSISPSSDKQTTWTAEWSNTVHSKLNIKKWFDYKDSKRRFKYRVDGDLRQNGLALTEKCNNYLDSKSFGLNAKAKKENGYSFFDFIFALKKLNFIKNGYLDNIGLYANERGLDTDSEKIKELANILKTEGNVVEIDVIGVATNQDGKNSKTLAKRRGDTLKKFIKDNVVRNINLSDDAVIVKIDEVEKVENKDVNAESSKKSRRVDVVIKLWKARVFGKIESPVIEETTEDKKVETNVAERLCRYDNEYRFFKNLEVTDPVLFRNIKSKFDYFDPAFHSMSPEGFNARLNFIQQCTRQGHTVSASEINKNSSGTAGNLSFGRPPVCVVKIGDFIHTRVLITSVGINYSNSNGITWDLNPEGSGVQPMYAKVTLGVNIIGGQSLNGPVSRLQNAQTFDYYANTGVYDDRSDIVSYKDGELRYDYVYDMKTSKTSVSNNKKLDASSVKKNDK